MHIETILGCVARVMRTSRDTKTRSRQAGDSDSCVTFS